MRININSSISKPYETFSYTNQVPRIFLANIIQSYLLAPTSELVIPSTRPKWWLAARLLNRSSPCKANMPHKSPYNQGTS